MTVYEILNKIQVELKAPKNQFNTFGKYKYRSCEDIFEAIKPLLSGAILTINDELIYIGNRFYVKATATITYDSQSISCSAYAREEETQKGMSASQLTGATSSYARKYSANGLFLIDDTKDADTADNTKPSTQVEKQTEDISEPKVTPQQKADIRAKMVAAGITERQTQTKFYEYVMFENTANLASKFLEGFDEYLEFFKKAEVLHD